MSVSRTREPFEHEGFSYEVEKEIQEKVYVYIQFIKNDCYRAQKLSTNYK